MANQSYRLGFARTTAILVIAVVVSAPAWGQGRLSLSERVERLEQQASSGGSQSAVDLVNKIQALQSQVQELQGQVEVLTQQLAESKRLARDQYIDLDSRIGKLEGIRGSSPVAADPAAAATDPGLQDIQLGSSPAPASDAALAPEATIASSSLTPADEGLVPPAEVATGAATDSAAPAVDSTADPAAEMRSYDEAFSALKDGRYAESARRFQGFIDQYPNADLTGNAYYWLGESYYVTQNYRVALDTFSALLTRFPDNQKAPDALLKVGYCQYELKQWDAAQTTLNQVVERYPDTTVSRLAQGRLRALRLENRR